MAEKKYRPSFLEGALDSHWLEAARESKYLPVRALGIAAVVGFAYAAEAIEEKGIKNRTQKDL